MKRGFMLTSIAIILFMILIDTAFQYSENSLAYSERISEMIVSEKVSYTFDDITEDITRIVGFNITQRSSDLIIDDSLPAGINVTTNLALYENFTRSYYLTPEIEAKFLDKNNQPINLTNLSSNISISPFNMTYGYTNFSKNNILIRPPSQLGVIQFGWYTLTVTNGNFSNFSSINWTPSQPQNCSAPTNCITLYLWDNLGISNYTSTFNSSFSGNLTANFVNQNCSLNISVGNPYLFNLTDGGCNISSEIHFTFNSSDMRLYFPEKLSIRDMDYNTSKKDNINVIVTTMLK
jgi:hypothetical protein